MDRMGIEISLPISFVLWNGSGLEIRGRLGQSLGSPGGSDSKESTCYVGDLGSIPGLERSLGEGNGYPLQYSWASLVAQLVKNPPAMQETWVLFLGWKDPLEKGKAIHSSILD